MSFLLISLCIFICFFFFVSGQTKTGQSIWKRLCSSYIKYLILHTYSIYFFPIRDLCHSKLISSHSLCVSLVGFFHLPFTSPSLVLSFSQSSFFVIPFVFHTPYIGCIMFSFIDGSLNAHEMLLIIGPI